MSNVTMNSDNQYILELPQELKIIMTQNHLLKKKKNMIKMEISYINYTIMGLKNGINTILMVKNYMKKNYQADMNVGTNMIKKEI